jgi:hypothetical protein
MTRFAVLALSSVLVVALVSACGDDEPAPPTGAGGQGGATTTSGGGGIGADGGGGQGGVGGGPECLNHSHCTEPGAAKCDPASNECVPCDPDDPDVATQCAGIAGKAICDGGTCVECTLGDESACVAPQTCDLDGKCCSGSIEPVGGVCNSLQPEVDVPGALCRQVGFLPNRCTYARGGPAQCLDATAAPGDTCGRTPTPTWCGG